MDNYKVAELINKEKNIYEKNFKKNLSIENRKKLVEIKKKLIGSMTIFDPTYLGIQNTLEDCNLEEKIDFEDFKEASIGSTIKLIYKGEKEKAKKTFQKIASRTGKYSEYNLILNNFDIVYQIFHDSKKEINELRKNIGLKSIDFYLNS